MSLVKSGQAITPTFTVTDPAGTGLINADSLPTGTVYVNGTANGATVTVTNLTTGKYKASVTLPSLSAGDTVELMISATVGAKSFAETVWRSIGDTYRISDIAGFVDTEIAALLDLVDTEVAQILAKVNNLPSDPADASDIAALMATAQAALTTIAGYTDTLEAGQATILSKLLKYVQLMVRKDTAIATDNATELAAINASGGSGAGAFASTTDSQEGIRDAISAGSASAEDIAAELVGIGAYVSAPSSTPAVGSLGVFVRATTWIMPAISVGALPVDREKLWFTVKTDPGLDDSAAILMVEETDGLLVLNGEEADDDTAASITYDDVDDEVTPRVETAATAAISPRGCLYFDVKYRAAGGADHYQVASGTFAVVWPITNAT